MPTPRSAAVHHARTWSKTPGKLWKVGGTAEEGARENPAFPPFLHLAAASIRRCCTCVPGVSDQMHLDRFKLINDSLGLEQGDQVLKAVAERLTRSLRKSDTVARLGGDEFMVLLLGTHGAEAAAKVAQKLLDSLRPPLKVNGHELTTAASIGLALFPHDGDNGVRRHSPASVKPLKNATPSSRLS